MAFGHVEDVLYGSVSHAAIEISIPDRLRREVGVERCRLVLVVLAHHGNDDNLAWPSIRTIAAATGIDGRKVRSALEVLEENRLIVRVGNQKVGRNGVIYYLNLPSFDSVEKHYQSMSPNRAKAAPSSSPEKPPATATETHPLECPTTDTRACTEVKGEVKEEEKDNLLSCSKFDLLFEEFWSVYPIKLERSRAFMAWMSLSMDKDSQREAIDALERALAMATPDQIEVWPTADRWILLQSRSVNALRQ